MSWRQGRNVRPTRHPAGPSPATLPTLLMATRFAAAIGIRLAHIDAAELPSHCSLGRCCTPAIRSHARPICVGSSDRALCDVDRSRPGKKLPIALRTAWIRHRPKWRGASLLGDMAHGDAHNSRSITVPLLPPSLAAAGATWNVDGPERSTVKSEDPAVQRRKRSLFFAPVLKGPDRPSPEWALTKLL